MPIYVYETVVDTSEHVPRRFEIFQKLSEEALKIDPETGEPVRRVITGTVAVRLGGLKRSARVNKRSPAATACGCATGALRPGNGARPHGACGHKH